MDVQADTRYTEGARAAGSAKVLSLRTALGVALLYASAYFLPLVEPSLTYYVSSDWRDILFPSGVAVAVLTAAILLWGRRLYRRPPSWKRTALVFLPLCVLVCIAMQSAFAAAGYYLIDIVLLAVPADLPNDWVRLTKVLLVFGILGVAVCLTWLVRARWRSLVRMLMILGYTYAALLAMRLITHAYEEEVANAVPARQPAPVMTSASSRRHVVWVIFDEMDYEKSFGNESGQMRAQLPNLYRLRDSSVSATHAYPPAKDTTESVPALLTGVSIHGTRHEERGALILQTSQGEVPFNQNNSIFVRVPGGAASVAVLGYYHPYCRLFPSVHPCQTAFLGNVGRWYDGLAFFSEKTVSASRWIPEVSQHTPEAVMKAFLPMYRISTQMAEALPRYLALQDRELVFIHLNIPHYPAEYAQRLLGLPPVANEREAYRQNLLLVDRLVGQIVTQIQAHAERSTGETLLVLSTDHWHRIESLTAARRIPFFAWHVGEHDPVTLEAPIATVNTADMILDFLAGNITTHAQLAEWWRDKPVHPTWIPSNYKN